VQQAGDQQVAQRRGLLLGAAMRAVQPLQRQSDDRGRSGIGEARGAMEARHAGDRAPDAGGGLARPWRR
jgi:hypothetical protein